MRVALDRESSAVARVPRRWLRRTGLLGVLVLVAIVGALVWKRARPAPEVDCATAFRTSASGITVLVCQREYERTKLPTTGAYLADALRKSSNTVAARALATDLLSTNARGDALQVLGRIALAENQTDAAVKMLQEARGLHRDAGKRAQLAVDDQVIAEIHRARKQYAEALVLLDECVSESRGGHDERTEALCRLTAARSLMNAGYFEEAHEEIDRAAERLTEDRDLAVVWYWRGNLEQEVVRRVVHPAHHEQAVAAFERSLELALRTQRTELLLNLQMNLAFSLAELGKTEEADRHLVEAGVLDRDGSYATQRKQIAAQIAYRRGNLTLAFSLNEQVYPTIDDPDEQIDVSVMQARIALSTNDLASASRWARRGVDSAEAVRAAQPLAELRPWILASRREPFELLFVAFARAGRTADAVGVFNQWQGRTLLDEMAHPSRGPSAGLSNAATRIQNLGRWLPAVSRVPLLKIDGPDVARAVAKIDLVALIVADNELWRLTATAGRFRIDDIGRFKDLTDLVDHFTTTPTVPALADALGARLLPDDVVRKTDEPLYVILDAPLGALPFVALRWHDQPLIAIRPVLRTPRLPVAGSCEPHRGIVGAVILADAVGDLPDARREAVKVASLYRTMPRVGAAATAEALLSVKPDNLLHVAVHADFDVGGGVLKLHDRAVSAPEIAANQLGPELAVLSACSTARASDPEIAGSLSTAFLAGGSHRVVATLRPVSDARAFELTSRFYDEHGAEDPVLVLAKVQAELAREGNQEWPNFAVFGNEVCSSRF